ncbi:hypothetical protein IKG73_02580 [Candidatus Saccharibacteria bacterium]|nr:hypothetical protein [Candidatus Saccharibacteria bacterium]
MKKVMIIQPQVGDSENPYEIKVRIEKPQKRWPFVVAIVLLVIFTIGMTTADIILWLNKDTDEKTEPTVTVEETTEAEDERPETGVTKAETETKNETELSLPRPIEIIAIAAAPNIEVDPETAFNNLRDYIISKGIDASFGYINLATGYTYTYQPDKIYYGASLVKTLDAMYAYEKLGGNLDSSARGLLINSVTYSKNEAHNALVEKFGRDNLKSYAEEIGMKYHLKGSSIYNDTYYFCDTTVRDQLIEWQRLWQLVNNLSNGHELLEMFSVGWWGVLQFSGHPQFMFKAGFYGPYYSETGLFLSRSPYIFTLLTKNGYRADKDYIMSDLSRRVYEINEAAF